MIRQVLEAFIYLQANGILHRDLKPENLLLSEGSIKLADFGWAVYANSAKRRTFCGTLLYVPPEMAQGESYDGKLDNWAVGVLSFELLVGKPPFESHTFSETLSAIKAGDVSIPSFLSVEASQFLSGLLVVDPQKRTPLSQALRHPFITKHFSS